MSTSKHFGYLSKPLFPGARGGEDCAAERRRLRRQRARGERFLSMRGLAGWLARKAGGK